jgi:Tfp pilus assembly protein PilX
MNTRRSSQRGAALIVSLIMLALIGMLVITSFKLGKSNLQIVGNMQQRSEALTAAQGAIESVISSTQFTATPSAAIVTPCGTANTACADANGTPLTANPGNGITVTVAMTCEAIQPISNAALNLANANDASCSVQSSQNFGVADTAPNNSLCANSVWDAQATAVDAVTSAQYVVNEGVAVRVPVTNVCP